MQNSTIFFIDNDESNLFLFGEILALTKQAWDLHLFLNPREALQNLVTISPAIIISDFKMAPEMDGLEFLTKSREICPTAVRLIFSSWFDIKLFHEAQRTGLIFSYLEKPADIFQVNRAIEEAHQRYILENKFKIRA